MVSQAKKEKWYGMEDEKMKMEKIEKGLLGIGMPALLLVFGLALSFSMVSFLNFGIWTQILGWIMVVPGVIGLSMALMKLPSMMK